MLMIAVILAVFGDEFPQQWDGGVPVEQLVLDGGGEVGGVGLVGASWIGGLVASEEGSGFGKISQVVVRGGADEAGGILE